jgi:predicted hydrocarbon binding protein
MPTYYLSNEMGRVLLGALRKELGNSFNEVIRASGQFQFGTSSLQTVDADKRYPFEAVSALQGGVEQVHGLNAPGLLRRVGRSAFVIGLSEMEPVVNIADLPLRRIPLNLKFSVGLEVLARILNKYTDQTVKVAELSDRYQWVVQGCPICWERRAESPSCHLVCGLLEEAFAWASGGGRYAVAETKCVARGDATCTFEIGKEPDPPSPLLSAKTRAQQRGPGDEARAHHVR